MEKAFLATLCFLGGVGAGDHQRGMSFGVWHWQTTLYLGMAIGDWVHRGLPGDLMGKAWLSRCAEIRVIRACVNAKCPSPLPLTAQPLAFAAWEEWCNGALGAGRDSSQSCPALLSFFLN